MTKETVWRILTKLLTNALALKMKWRGAYGKQAFKPLVLKGTVLSNFAFRATAWGIPE